MIDSLLEGGRPLRVRIATIAFVDMTGILRASLLNNLAA